MKRFLLSYTEYGIDDLFDLRGHSLDNKVLDIAGYEMRPLKNVQFCSMPRQFCRIAELDSCQAARKGEGHGSLESTRRFKQPQRNRLRISRGRHEYI
jgi:hypothetical protein